MKRLLVAAVLAAPGMAWGQGRVDLSGEAWFRGAGKDGRWAGVAHVKVEAGVEGGKAVVRYFEEAAVELDGVSQGWREEWVLDQDLAVLSGVSRRRDGRAEAEVRAACDGRQLVRRAVAPAVERVQPWTRERACWPAGFAPAALMRRYGPWKPGMEMSVETFSARAADGDVRIGQDAWSVTVRSRGPRAVADAEEDCWTLELRPVEGAGAPVTLVVDGRGIPVEMSGPAWTFRRVRGRREALDGRDFAWVHGARRDPFRPVLSPLDVRRIGGEPEPVADLSAAEARAILDGARARLDAMRAAATLPEAERERALAENSRAIRSAAARLRGSAVAGAAERISEMVAEAGRLYDPALAAVSGARALFREIREAFDAGDAASLARVGPAMAALHEIASDPDLAGRPEQATVRAVEEEAAALDRRAAVRLEGLEKLGEHPLTGIVVVRDPVEVELPLGIQAAGAVLEMRPRLAVRGAAAVALLGDRSYAPGEAVAGVEGCVVKEIRNDSVTVEYRGEPIRLRVGE